MSNGEKPVSQISVDPYPLSGTGAEIFQMPDGEIYLGSDSGGALPLSDDQLATLQKMLNRRARNFSVVTT